MQPIDESQANLLKEFKANKTPHTFQCSLCGTWYGNPPLDDRCVHKWVIRDIRPFQNESENDETSSTDSSV